MPSFKKGDLITWVDKPDPKWDKIQVESWHKWVLLNGPGPFTVEGGGEGSSSVRIIEPMLGDDGKPAFPGWWEEWFQLYIRNPLTLEEFISLITEPLKIACSGCPRFSHTDKDGIGRCSRWQILVDYDAKACVREECSK